MLSAGDATGYNCHTPSAEVCDCPMLIDEAHCYGEIGALFFSWQRRSWFFGLP
jgi:hypothetical protein